MAPQPYSQPAVDLLSVDFSSPGQALVADVRVLDLDAPIVGEGTEGYDTVGYVVAFSPDPSGPLWVNFGVDYDAEGMVIRASLVVFFSLGGGESATRPLDVRADTSRNRISFDAPLAVLNEAIAEVCPECAPVRRGSELHTPFGSTRVLDNGTFGPRMIANDSTSTSSSSPSYFVGD